MNQYRSIRLFKNPVLEAFTHVHPSVPLILWGPFAVFLFWAANRNQLNFWEWSAVIVSGLLFWTLFEYLLHRFLFHMKISGKISHWIVYLFHGLHHDDPEDPTRLVMPPLPAIVYVSLLYGLFHLILPERYFHGFLGAFLTGYLCYDYIHFATHHFKMTSRVGRYLKKWHLQHHYRHEKAKYGVSSPLWDYVFQTVDGPKEDHPLYQPDRVRHLNQAPV